DLRILLSHTRERRAIESANERRGQEGLLQLQQPRRAGPELGRCDLSNRVCLRCLRSKNRAAYLPRRTKLVCERLARGNNWHRGCNEVDLPELDGFAYPKAGRDLEGSELYLRRAWPTKDARVGAPDYLHVHL